MPSQLTGIPLYLIIAIIVLPFALSILVGIFRRRESIRYWIRKALICESVYVGLALILLKVGQPPLVSVLAGLVAALIVDSRFKPRSRRVSAGVKRKARARHELKTGKKFNPKRHEYDHKVPFSKGGSHTADNIEVVERKANRSKGAASPWWDILGR